MLVRTWNLFHGNAFPPERRAFLRRMIELVTRDRPDVVCLQELPVWALRHLERWSGMHAICEVARSPRVGSPVVGRWITELHHGLLRAALTGEADAILVDRRFAVSHERRVVIASAPLRRLVHSVLLDDDVAVVNFHISGVEDQWDVVKKTAEPWERVVVAGDANIRGASIRGFSPSLAGSLDQLLVRGLALRDGPSAWPVERRTVGGRVLSDHAPLEAVVE